MTATPPRTTLEPEASVTRPERAMSFTKADYEMIRRLAEYLPIWTGSPTNAAIAVFARLRRDGFEIVEKK